MSERQPHEQFPSSLPGELTRLQELAYNLWWSWTPDARRLFETIDPTLWRLSHHNPVKLLHDLKPERLASLNEDPVFIRLYSSVLKAFDAYMGSSSTWVANRHPHLYIMRRIPGLGP